MIYDCPTVPRDQCSVASRGLRPFSAMEPNRLYDSHKLGQDYGVSFDRPPALACLTVHAQRPLSAMHAHKTFGAASIEVAGEATQKLSRFCGR
jgi:hypothetical protein